MDVDEVEKAPTTETTGDTQIISDETTSAVPKATTTTAYNCRTRSERNSQLTILTNGISKQLLQVLYQLQQLKRNI